MRKKWTYGLIVLGGLLSMSVLNANEGLAQSRRQCEDYARRHAARYDRGDDVLGGAVVGGVGGALIGGLAGGRRGVAPGAIIGTGVGAISGAAGSDSKRRRAYWDAYNDCMDRSEPVRYDRPTRYDDDPPRPWTREWYDYCSQRYRSFNPDTGRYIDRNGVRRFCR